MLTTPVAREEEMQAIFFAASVVTHVAQKQLGKCYLLSRDRYCENGEHKYLMND